MLLAVSSCALPFFFPKLSALLFVKQVASYVKVELNLRQDSRGSFQPALVEIRCDVGSELLTSTGRVSPGR